MTFRQRKRLVSAMFLGIFLAFMVLFGLGVYLNA